MNRSEVRELAFELLYSLEIQKIEESELEEQIKLFLESEEASDIKAKKYVTDVICGVYKNSEKIINIISKNLSQNWQMDRISKTSIALLKLATYEIVYKKIPYKIVINEVVELAKTYGDDNTPSFVNGILAKIVRQNNN